MRFDLIHRDGGKMDLIFTWSHLLMDATAAEHFLAAVSDKTMILPKANPQQVSKTEGSELFSTVERTKQFKSFQMSLGLTSAKMVGG